MATYVESGYHYCWLDPQGNLTYSAFKADIDSPTFVDFGQYIIPLEWTE